MIKPEDAIQLIQSYGPYLRNNAELIDIFEGNLLPYLDKELKEQLNPQSYIFARQRVMPINVLPKIIDKLTNIYQTSVIREVQDGTDQDQELVDWYVEKMKLNQNMNCSNELFNLCKNTLLYPYVDKGLPYLRVILNDRFVVSSANQMNPQEATDVVICHGKKMDQELYWVFGVDGFYAVKADGSRDLEEMLRIGNPAGINPYGVLPFVYTADSKYKLMPTQDTDISRVVKTLPVMLTDLNLAAMFQSFSIIYGIDIDDENIKMVPNAFWRLKSDPHSDKKPEIGSIKPQVDFDQVLNLIQSELAMWLGSRGIRSSTIGNLQPEGFASGISKVIDEMDTFEARQKQVTTYARVEESLWDLILNYLHPVWVRMGVIDNRRLPTAGVKVKTTFAVQLPMQSRGQIVRDLKDEVAAGFTTRQRAIQTLNPDYTDGDVAELMGEIEQERNNGMAADNPGDPNGVQAGGPGGPGSAGDQGNN